MSIFPPVLKLNDDIFVAGSMFKVVGSLQSKSTRRVVGTATRLFIPHECSSLF